jgi:hypothetical protein
VKARPSEIAGPLGIGALRLDRLGIAIGGKKPLHAVDVREVGAMLIKVALKPGDAPGDLGALLAERGNDMGISHPNMGGWPLSGLNAAVVALATNTGFSLYFDTLPVRSDGVHTAVCERRMLPAKAAPSRDWRMDVPPSETA